MKGERVWVVGSGMVTAYGHGTRACWKGLMSGKTGIRRLERFSTTAFHSDVAAWVDGLDYHGSESLAMQMVARIFDGVTVPPESRIILATTKGEVDLMERLVGRSQNAASAPRLTDLLEKVRARLGLSDPGIVVSAACASSTSALAMASSWIQRGDADCVLVVACDSVSEFVFSGFSALMALDPVPARPFDRDRKGLSIGEGAAWALLMSEHRARTSGYSPEGEISGWGQSSDANHMTGPSRDGSGQALAIRKALKRADLDPGEVGSICAHGTGTLYNDSMELKAIRLVFGEREVPVYSVKGGLGHSMGAAGLIEVLLALKSLAEGRTPPVVNLVNTDDEARGLVSPESRAMENERYALSTNSGFGGINAAVVLRSAKGLAS